MKKLNFTNVFKKLITCGLAVALLVTAIVPGQWNSGNTVPKNPPSVETNEENPTSDRQEQG